MKRFIASLALLAGVFLFSWLSLLHLQQVDNSIKEDIFKVEQYAMIKDYTAAEEILYKVKSSWKSHHLFFHGICGKTNIAPFEATLEQCEILLSQREHNRLLETINQLKSELNLLWESQSPSIKALL